MAGCKGGVGDSQLKTSDDTIEVGRNRKDEECGVGCLTLMAGLLQLTIGRQKLWCGLLLEISSSVCSL